MAEFGCIYIVSTPIGNLSDFSPRGTKILSAVDVIAAEDTRRSIILLNKLGIKNKLVSNHKYNEYGKSKYFIDLLTEGKSIAVISDAGTPCISDPGNELIKAAIEKGITIVGIPGCCALTTAASISGFDLRTFEFLGFFPRTNSDRKKLISKMRRNQTTKTYVIYESPKRLIGLLEFFVENKVLCNLCVCNDISKLNEYTMRGTPSEVLGGVKSRFDSEPKGEYSVVIELLEEYIITEVEQTVSAECFLVEAMFKNNCSIKQAVNVLRGNDSCGYSKKELYNAGLRLKKLFVDMKD